MGAERMSAGHGGDGRATAQGRNTGDRHSRPSQADQVLLPVSGKVRACVGSLVSPTRPRLPMLLSVVECSMLSEVMLMPLAFAMGDGAAGGRVQRCSPTVQQRTEQQIQRIADNVEILVQHCRQWGEQVHTLVFGARPGHVGLCWRAFVAGLDGGRGFPAQPCCRARTTCARSSRKAISTTT